MAINYNQETYNLIVETKKFNEEYIDELNATMNSKTFDDKLDAIKLLNALSEINIEYEKYIVVYNAKNKKPAPKTQYTVNQGDTLPRVAYLTTGSWQNWERIYVHNELNDLKLTAGQILEIPDGI